MRLGDAHDLAALRIRVAATIYDEGLIMQLDCAQLQEMIANDPYMLLVDVRDEEEFDAGHIPAAGNMSVDDIVDCLFDEAISERGLDAIANGKGMEMADDASVIVLYSSAGERSARAVEHMESLGYVNVYNAPGLSSWPYEVVTTAEEAAVAAALVQNDMVASAAASEGTECGCGHDHGNAHNCDCEA